MIKIKNGDILKCEEDIIVHQVNIEGIMGGGVAKQIASQYPETKKEYIEFCNKHNFIYGNLRGQAFLNKEKEKYIGNIFSQDRNFNTDYEAMEIALNKIKEFAKKQNLSIAMPYKIGCGIANGDWTVVLNNIEKVFIDYKVSLYKLGGDDE